MPGKRLSAAQKKNEVAAADRIAMVQSIYKKFNFVKQIP